MSTWMYAAGAAILSFGAWIGISRSESDAIIFDGTGTLEGYVIDAITQTPIEGANIQFHDAVWFKTDSIGAFKIESLASGTYHVSVSAPGYSSYTEEISIEDNSTIQRIFQLSLASISIADTMIIKKDAEVMEEVTADYVEMESTNRFRLKTEGKADKSYMASPMTIQGYSMHDSDEEFYNPNYNTESYSTITENGFKQPLSDPLSTFSIDVDNASYANIRRFIQYGQQIPKDAVRIEEMVNYFDYTYAQPKNNEPFAVHYELSDCPWNPESQILMIGLQGKDIDYSKAAPSNLVFLIDVSGSMGQENKLPLVKSSLNYLVDQLRPTDRVALVVYAGAAGEVLPSTPASDKEKIKQAIQNLESGGSTAGGAGIQLAYDIAQKNMIEDGNNRVILCTDGDFNIGSSSDAEMTRLIEDKRKSGVFITVCGFGMGNYKDSKMESIADNGNGSYYYIDTKKEAEKVFGTDMRGTLFTIAKDVKIQIEFNPALVESYRLIGYENRVLNKEDFNDDTKDAGELGAGHRVTALYEIKRTKNSYQPNGMSSTPQTQQLKYQSSTIDPSAYNTQELMTLQLRYKDPKSSTSKLIEKAVYNSPVSFAGTSDNFRFACAVTEFGMVLRDSEFKGDASLTEILQLASGAKGNDALGYRTEFIDLVKQYSGVASIK